MTPNRKITIVSIVALLIVSSITLASYQKIVFYFKTDDKPPISYIVSSRISKANKWFSRYFTFNPVIRVLQVNTLEGREQVIVETVDDILSERFFVKLVNHDEDYDIVIDYGYKGMPDKIENYKGIKIFYTGEAFVPNMKEYDLVLGFSKITKASNYHRLPNYFITYKEDLTQNDRKKRNKENCKTDKKYFACFLVSNAGGAGLDGAEARGIIFNKLSEYKRVESGGRYLNNIGGKSISSFQTQEWLSNCKFVISYENQSSDGYITEKVFQAYFAGAVPIYYGDKTAVTDINKKAIIYAQDFKDNDAIIDNVKQLDNNDDLYCAKWSQDIMTHSQKDYIQSIYPELREKLFKIIDEKFYDEKINRQTSRRD